ncbi:hypothetical protein [Deminuibacter soli]|uniref:Uncharacterized protein n=1 Tax=Deminuibacter soli TaxID=2291815 RepID=A0A3E1NJ76_9BACT|nr:hypothetical protein [Deminuibacter soli]RFM27931.1 hypothetical protein DXN05_10310 [Deminuibacter soli]
MSTAEEKQQVFAWKDLSLRLPPDFSMVCTLLDVSPEQVLIEFMDNVSRRIPSKGDAERDAALNYMLHCQYGNHLFNPADYTALFKELDAIRSLWPQPKLQTAAFIDDFVKWRSILHRNWFNKWYQLSRKIQ